MSMIQYITEIQRRIIEDYGFPAGANGCPQNVPDGAYPMMIEKKLDLVIIKNETISCCNFIADKKELRRYQKEVRTKLSQHNEKP